MAYETQVAALKLNPLYQGSIEYRDYVDKLVALSDQQVEHLKQEEAHLMMLQAQDAAHHESLQRFQFQNESLVRGEDIPGNEVALTHQVALLNAILIEIASIQAETKVVQHEAAGDRKSGWRYQKPRSDSAVHPQPLKEEPHDSRSDDSQKQRVVPRFHSNPCLVWLVLRVGCSVRNPL
jgi:hypothetical protein